MQKHVQTFEQLVKTLTPMDATITDAFSSRVGEFVDAIPPELAWDDACLKAMLAANDFEIVMAAFQLFLELSKDEFTIALRKEMQDAGIGVKAFKADPDGFVAALQRLGLGAKTAALINQPITWRDLVKQRHALGRGRAIKGQTRGRLLEDKVEEIVKEVFGEAGYDSRCRFTGKDEKSDEKADFAIPSKTNPRILIEVKAYGATGSKQTDVLGDMERIVRQKRHDTTLLVVTDGTTWTSRANDLRKLLKMQSEGSIGRVYTLAMFDELRTDLKDLKAENKI